MDPPSKEDPAHARRTWVLAKAQTPFLRRPALVRFPLKWRLVNLDDAADTRETQPVRLLDTPRVSCIPQMPDAHIQSQGLAVRRLAPRWYGTPSFRGISTMGWMLEGTKKMALSTANGCRGARVVISHTSVPGRSGRNANNGRPLCLGVASQARLASLLWGGAVGLAGGAGMR